MKKGGTIILLWVLIISAIAGNAQAFTATVSYFFKGIDLNVGVVSVPPTRMIIVYGDPGDVAEALMSPKP